ncbi:MAG: pilus assembly protein FimV [Oleispira sp.]|jgi:pilus assembly protein FimV
MKGIYTFVRNGFKIHELNLVLLFAKPASSSLITTRKQRMKRTLLSTLVITSTLGLSANVFALGMGELELKSTLNQPLQAEIKLSNIDDLTEWEIKPSLASDGDFDRAGVEKVFFLSDIDFEIKGNRIVLTSDKSVTEPFLNFLVQVNWPSGRVLREYTLLLDPPVFDDAIQPLAAKQTSQRVETQTVATAPVKAAKTPNTWQSEAAVPGTYKVQKDDTLWEIAINTRPSRQVSPQQMMLAIQDSNPGAFINGNINRLKTHKVLRIPTQQQMAARNDSQAVNEVLRQNRELRTAGAQIDATANAGETNKAEQLSGGGELKLLSKQSQVAESSGAGGDIERGEAGNGRQEGIQNDLAIALETLDTSTLENNDLKERLASLEEQIATLQRLVSLKDDQLASIQTIDLQKEAQLESVPEDFTETDDTGITENLTDADAVLAAGMNTLDDVAVEGSAEDFNYDGAVAEAEVEAEIDPALVAAQMQQQAEDRYKPKGFVAEMLAKPALAGGIAGGILLLLGLIGLGIKKRRDAKEGDIEDPELAGFDENFEFSEGDLDESSLDDFEFDENDSVSEDNELNDDLLEGIGSEDDDLEIETTDTVAQTSDVIGEAEIYIAYGRFDQAADLLKNSIEQEPSRIDLRVKLLEVYLETDDATSFAETELDLNSIGDLEANEKAVAMRSRLSSPISGEDETLIMDELMLDDADIGIDMEALADSEDEFADGIDFEAALDLTEGDDSSDIELSLNASDEDNASSDILDTDAIETDTINIESDWDAETELDIEFNLDDAESIPTLDNLSDELSLEDVPVLDDDLDGLEGFDEIPTLESEEDLASIGDIPTLEEASLDDLLGEDLSEGSAEDFDLSELSDTASTEENKLSSNDSFTDLASMAGDDSSAEIAELTNLLDSDEEIYGLPDLDFDLDETGFEVGSLENDSLDGDLQALESELNDLTFTEKNSPVIENVPVLDEIADFDASLEFDLNELEDLPDFTTEDDIDIAKDKVTHAVGQDIDLEQLAAADDEFDFLAGTDECATKLDLARAYLDMEDSEGAKELLQEVVAEGSDQQKQDARALMDSIG